MNATEIVALARGSGVGGAAQARKDIQAIKRFRDIIVFRVGTETNKKILEADEQ